VRRAWWPVLPPLVFLASLALPRVAADPARDFPPDALASIPVPAPIRKEESTGLRRRAFDLERAAGERDLPDLKELAQAMRQISEELRRSEMSKSDALSKLSRLEDQVKERKKEFSQEAGLRDSHTRQPDGGATSPAGEEAARRAEEFDRKLQDLKAQLEQARSELAKAGKEGKSLELQAALDKLGRELEGLDAAKMGELGKELEKLAEEGDAEALGKMLESLDGELDDLEGLMDGIELLEGELEALKAMKGRVAGDFKTCFFCGKMGEG
jgi:chromosome segregation ATPase